MALSDVLNFKSRSFYESTIMKMMLSIVFGASACFFLGMAASTASKATAERTMKSMPHEGDDEIYTVIIHGFGFGAFCYFLAFFLGLSAAIIVSPACIGSKKEYNNLKKPGEFSVSSAPV